MKLLIPTLTYKFSPKHFKILHFGVKFCKLFDPDRGKQGILPTAIF